MGGSYPATWLPGEFGQEEFINTKSLAFDGSDQHLTTAADSTLATKTYSFWAQSADTGLNVVFDHGSANKGGFMFNGSSGRPLLYLADNYYRYFDDTSCQDDGSWHHWLLLLTTDVSNSRLFCDGVEVSADSTSTSDGAGLAYSTGIRLGRGGSYYFSGHLDEFAIFDGDKTGIVADLYNNGLPTDLSGTAGLEHWWRMGDATEPDADGTSSLIYDQAGSSNATMTNMATSDFVQYTPNSYILSDLGITPDLAVSMTRKLVSDYSGSFYATSGSDVTTIYDQSGNSRNLTNWDDELVLDDTELSGSGHSARAVFNDSASTVLTTSTAGSAFAAGNHDVFIVFDPVGSNKQIIFGRGSHGGDFLAMDNGSSSNCINGITIGAVRVNDTVLTGASHVSRDTLWDAMTIAGTMGGLNVLSLEDVDLSSISGDIRLGVSHNTWKLEGSFAEFIITPALTDAEHSAIVENIRAHYDAP